MVCYICGDRRALIGIPGTIDDPDRIARRHELARLHREEHRRNDVEINANDRICINCNTRLNNTLNDERDPAAIILNVLVSGRTTNCFVCQRECGNRVRLEARVHFYVKTEIYIPSGTRCCLQHYNEKGQILPQHQVNHNSIRRGAKLEGNEIASWFRAFKTLAEISEKNRFETEDNFEEDDVKNLTALSKTNFRNLYAFCGPVELYGNRRNINKKDLFAFLIKMRQGVSDDFIKSIMQYKTRQSVSNKITAVRTSLMQRFVPQNIGLNSIEAQDRAGYLQRHVMEPNDGFANYLYNPEPNIPRAILYPDCTYLKAPKSRNFKVARQSYSMHKKYTLLKVGLVVAPDGHILDVHGPYFSDTRNNDAAILIHDMNQDRQNLQNWLQNGDIFVVDRGYRDALAFLDNLNINHEMPPMMPRGQRQFTTEQANQSRLVTKTRWIVETRNGHLKSIFKFFRDMIPMQHCYNLGDFVKIACAMINAFFPLIHMQNVDHELALRMREIALQPNVLQERVERDRLHLRVGNNIWIEMNQAHLPGFPRLPEEYLRDKTFGTYQVYLAPGYIQDRLLREQVEDFVFETQLFEPGLIRVRLYSRMSQATRHMTYIAFIENFEMGHQIELPMEEPIRGYYCTCKAGARTLGCCAHVASILWYLGFARHEQDVHYPTDRLLRTVLDAANRNVEEPEVIDEQEHINVVPPAN